MPVLALVGPRTVLPDFDRCAVVDTLRVAAFLVALDVPPAAALLLCGLEQTRRPQGLDQRVLGGLRGRGRRTRVDRGYAFKGGAKPPGDFLRVVGQLGAPADLAVGPGCAQRELQVHAHRQLAQPGDTLGALVGHELTLYRCA